MKLALFSMMSHGLTWANMELYMDLHGSTLESAPRYVPESRSIPGHPCPMTVAARAFLPPRKPSMQET